MSYLNNYLHRILCRKKGTTAASYALIVGLLAIGILGSIVALGDNVAAILGLAEDEIETAATNGGGGSGSNPPDPGAPTIDDIADYGTAIVDTSVNEIAFTVGDPDGDPNALTITAVSSNQSVVPDGNITLGGTGTTRTISFSDVPAAGTTTITVTVDDGTHTTQDTFDLTTTGYKVFPGGRVGFAGNISIDGNRVVVSDSPYNSFEGAVYIYEWTGSSWSESFLQADTPRGNESFGWAIDVSGDRIVVGTAWTGAPEEVVYIFDRNGGSWDQTTIQASDIEFGDGFGRAVAIDGDRIAVSAPGEDANGSNAGALYIYDWNGSSWVETKLLASDGAANDSLGAQSMGIDISGDRVAISSKSGSAGSVYVFEGAGSWAETKITSSDGAAGDAFGANLAIDGDILAVAAYSDDDDGSDSGAAYIYDKSGGSWVETKLTPSDGAADKYFGGDIGVSGNRVIIGAVGDTDNGPWSGAAYLFEFSGGTWNETKFLTPDGVDDDDVGWAVDISGSRFVLGVDGDDGFSGSAYLYDR